MRWVKVNCKTGEVVEGEDDEPHPSYPLTILPKGIDLDKLKAVLLKTRIIKNLREIE